MIAVSSLAPDSDQISMALHVLSISLLMPNAIPVLHTDLIAKQDLSPSTLPAAIPRAGQHEAASRIDVDGRDDAAAVARNNSKRHRAMAGGFGLGDVVDAQNVVGSTAKRVSRTNAHRGSEVAVWWTDGLWGTVLTIRDAVCWASPGQHTRDRYRPGT